jgi:hypothetical protein
VARQTGAGREICRRQYSVGMLIMALPLLLHYEPESIKIRKMGAARFSETPPLLRYAFMTTLLTWDSAFYGIRRFTPVKTSRSSETGSFVPHDLLLNPEYKAQNLVAVRHTTVQGYMLPLYP